MKLKKGQGVALGPFFKGNSFGRGIFLAKFCPLSSSSAGNCTYISASGGTVLVDAGISCRKMQTFLREIDSDLEEIQAVLVTHEHIDHIKGLKTLLNYFAPAIYGTKAVLNYLVCHEHIPAKTKIVEVDHRGFCVAGMQISAFDTPHDSVGSVGYRIQTADGCSIAVATDIGEINEAVTNGIIGCDLVMLEANYDPTLLQMGSYPYYLKRRIASATGHLANEHCAGLAQQLIATGTSRLILAHLSKENNTPKLACQTVGDALYKAGWVEGRDYMLEVAPYSSIGKLVRF